MKKLIISLAFLFVLLMLNSQANSFYLKLYSKELATFNDGLTLMRLLYNEQDDRSSYLENILWAAEKKLFQVKIPIEIDQIDPILTRRELSTWICRIFSGKKGIINNPNIMKYGAFRLCVELGIVDKGRGAFDSFTGAELIETFAYLDYYVRANQIKPDMVTLEIYNDDYTNLPEWRQRLYRELDQQRLEEREKKNQLKNKKKKDAENIIRKKQNEKVIEKKLEE